MSLVKIEKTFGQKKPSNLSEWYVCNKCYYPLWTEQCVVAKFGENAELLLLSMRALVFSCAKLGVLNDFDGNPQYVLYCTNCLKLLTVPIQHAVPLVIIDDNNDGIIRGEDNDDLTNNTITSRMLQTFHFSARFVVVTSALVSKREV